MARRGLIGQGVIGYCARSGKKMLLSEMVEDGYYPGLLVDPEWRDAEHPLDTPTIFVDETVVDRPAPRNYAENQTIYFPTYNDQFAVNRPIIGFGFTGTVDVLFGQDVFPTGVSGTGAVGDTGEVVSVAATGVSGTGAIGDTGEVISVAATGVSGTGAIGNVTVTIGNTFWGSDTWGSGAWGD